MSIVVGYRCCRSVLSEHGSAGLLLNAYGVPVKGNFPWAGDTDYLQLRYREGLMTSRSLPASPLTLGGRAMGATDLLIPLSDREVLSIQQTANLLGVHRVTVHGLVSTGRLASVKIGRRRLITRTAIDDLLASAMEIEALPRRDGDDGANAPA